MTKEQQWSTKHYTEN